MIIVKLQGGLGNQFFQYAMGRSLSSRLGVELMLDVSSYINDPKRDYELGKYNINAKIASESEVARCTNFSSILVSKMSRFIKPLYGLSGFVSEKFFEYDPRVMRLPDNRYLFGYWQSSKYFESVQNLLKKELIPKKPLDRENQKTLMMLKGLGDSVCITIRRGDFVSDSKATSFHGTCDIDYYKRSMKLIENKLKNVQYCVFTDDQQWALESLNSSKPMIFVGTDNMAAAEKNMLLMSQCKNFIIANSSYGWWGAWLSENRDKIVIAPKRWFANKEINTSDLCPRGWVRI